MLIFGRVYHFFGGVPILPQSPNISPKGQVTLSKAKSAWINQYRILGLGMEVATVMAHKQTLQRYQISAPKRSVFGEGAQISHPWRIQVYIYICL